MMSEVELQELAVDTAANGRREPITLWIHPVLFSTSETA